MKFINEIRTMVQQRPDIRVALILGSYADNKDKKRKDKFSDIDLFFICDEPKKYLNDISWLSFHGKILCYFNDPISMGIGTELRVVFYDELLVDIAIVTFDEFIQLKKNKLFSTKVLSRGMEILKNNINNELFFIEKHIENKDDQIFKINRKFDEFCIDMAVICKYLKRKDYFSAYYAFNRRIVKLLLWSIEELEQYDSTKDIYFNGRYMHKWLEKDKIEQFNKCIRCGNWNLLHINIIDSISLFKKNIDNLLSMYNAETCNNSNLYLEKIKESLNCL